MIGDFSIGGLLASLLVAVVTAIVTVHLSLRRFRAESWWEEKLSAYSTIMEHLAAMKFYRDAWLERAYGIQQLPEDLRDEAEQKSTEAKHELAQIRATGSFRVRDDAVEALESLQSELARSPAGESLEESVEKDSSAIRDCMQRIRTVAKDDLETTTRKLGYFG